MAYVKKTWVTGDTIAATDLNNIENGIETLDTGKQDVLTAGTNIQITSNVISATDTTYESKTAASGGTDVSLCTTGEKYTWNTKQNTLSGGTGAEVASDTVTVKGVEYKNNETIQSSALKFVRMTAAEYAAITPDANTFYIIIG